jgi:hypothetical protein
MTREDGRVIDNQHDAAFFAIWATVQSPAVKKWEAQHEKN